LNYFAFLTALTVVHVLYWRCYLIEGATYQTPEIVMWVPPVNWARWVLPHLR